MVLTLLLLIATPGQATTAADATLEWLMHQVAREEGVDPALLRAVVAAESGFDPYAVSSAGAVGLMQLMKPTAIDMGVRNRYDPYQNLRGGARYLRQMMEQFSSLPLALAAYNAGPGAVSQHNGIPPFSETRNYVKKVLGLYRGKGEVSYQSMRRTGTIRLPQSNKKIFSYRDANGTLVLTDVNPKNKKPTGVLKVARSSAEPKAASANSIITVAQADSKKLKSVGTLTIRQPGRSDPVIRVVQAEE